MKSEEFKNQLMELILLKEIYIAKIDRVEEVLTSESWVAKTMDNLITKKLVIGNGTTYDKYRITHDGAVILHENGETIKLMSDFKFFD